MPCGSAVLSFFKLLLVNKKWYEFLFHRDPYTSLVWCRQLLETPLLTDITNMEFLVYMHMVYVILVEKTISMVCMSISLHATLCIIFLLIKSGYLGKFQIDLHLYWHFEKCFKLCDCCGLIFCCYHYLCNSHSQVQFTHCSWILMDPSYLLYYQVTYLKWSKVNLFRSLKWMFLYN